MTAPRQPESEGLKACPFCGGETTIIPTLTGAVLFHESRDLNCPSRTIDGMRHYASRAEAIAAWNRRQPDEGWVRCEERLPEVGQRVLAFPDAEGTRVVYGTHSLAHLVGSSGGALEMPGHITHWRPLPEPPKDSR